MAFFIESSWSVMTRVLTLALFISLKSVSKEENAEFKILREPTAPGNYGFGKKLHYG